MGIYDRDYYREPSRSRLGSMSAWSVNTWLIIINITVFVMDHVLHNVFPYNLQTALGYYDQYDNALYAQQLASMPPLTRWGHFSMFLAVNHGQVWRFITFQFLHSYNSPSHIFGNMLGLYFFGQMLESYLTSRRYLVFYLLCGMSGALMYLVLIPLHGIGSPQTPLVGASAGIFGILIAAAVVAPDTTIMLMFPPIPMKMKTFALVILAIAVFTVFTNGDNAGGQAAHLGGAGLGFLLIRYPFLLDWAAPRRKMRIAPQKDWRRDMDR